MCKGSVLFRALGSDLVSNLCFRKIRFQSRIKSVLSIGFGFGKIFECRTTVLASILCVRATYKKSVVLHIFVNNDDEGSSDMSQ